MSKPTTEDKVKAIDAMLWAIRFDVKDDRMWGLYSEGMQQEIERHIAKLEKDKHALLHPAPKPSRKPKAPAMQEAVASDPIATYAPSGEYKNAKEKRGRAK